MRVRRGAYTLGSVWAASDEAARHLLGAHAVALKLSSPIVFSHVTAAVAHGLPVHRVPLDEVHVTHPGAPGRTRHEAGVWHHTGNDGPPVTAQGLSVTALARTAFDVARASSTLAGALVTADAAAARLEGTAALVTELAARRDWPGSVRAVRAFALADERSESPGETVTRLAFHAVGMPPDELQWVVHTHSGPKRCDYAWVEERIVGEFDGKVKYGRLLKPGQTASDVLVAERQRELEIEREDWDMVRFTWREGHDHDLVRHRLLEARDRAAARRPRAS